VADKKQAADHALLALGMPRADALSLACGSAPERPRERCPMLELPEVVTIARQMRGELVGKTVASAHRENSPHKFVFYGCDRETFEATPRGGRVTDVSAGGKWVYVTIGGHTLMFGDIGGRALYHETPATLPEKYHALLRFDDGSAFSITVQGWGFLRVEDNATAAGHEQYGDKGLYTLSDDFTAEEWVRRLRDFGAANAKSIKYFMISGPSVPGIGNSYLQDMLYRAGIHPTRPVADINDAEAERLHAAIRETLSTAIDLGGRDEERDLYGRRGGYARVLGSKTRGKPCPECGALIEKIQYLGGAAYFCPLCQT
jgi:formamidopyrimidine-DNA glycosylase